MAEKGKNVFDVLFQKVNVRVFGDVPKEDELDAGTVDYIMSGMLYNYNLILNRKVAVDTQALNKKIKRTMLSNKNIPYISGITPIIDAKGNQSIVVTFEYDGRCMGIARINKDMTITFDFLRNGCSMPNTIDMLNKNYENFVIYFNALESFALDYPGIACEFGPQASRDTNNIQRLDDGFLGITLDINNPDGARIGFVNLSDTSVASEKSAKYGRIEETLEAFRPDILKRFVVNEEELNPLYKAVLEKYRKQIDEGKGLSRVLNTKSN